MSELKNELIVLKKAKEFVRLVYGITKLMPEKERYILIPQLLRSAISVPSNLAEGNQKTKAHFIEFIRTARGSLKECEVQLSIVYDEYKIQDVNKALELADEIGRMTYSLLSSLSDN
jgi:four helix bundle protein